ncbi:hypothetical protein M885DRAFT_518759 [Pelagophyceae sp. CCMP2097]|nr:hypothetical protein M885DRAFT_518759 [Pelagophyceae sp. CCMP2097]
MRKVLISGRLSATWTLRTGCATVSCGTTPGASWARRRSRSLRRASMVGRTPRGRRGRKGWSAAPRPAAEPPRPSPWSNAAGPLRPRARLQRRRARRRGGRRGGHRRTTPRSSRAWSTASWAGGGVVCLCILGLASRQALARASSPVERARPPPTPPPQPPKPRAPPPTRCPRTFCERRR